MAQWTAEAEQILLERFGKDSLISLATVFKGIPYVRIVNTFYWDGAFYVLTDARSHKMHQLAENPVAAIAGDWFTAHGKAESLGAFSKPENRKIAKYMRDVFSSWIDNGHSELTDPNTIILRITVTDGVLYSHGTRYECTSEYSISLGTRNT